MPGKYSHSVVLAHYSDRGWISPSSKRSETYPELHISPSPSPVSLTPKEDSSIIAIKHTHAISPIRPNQYEGQVVSRRRQSSPTRRDCTSEGPNYTKTNYSSEALIAVFHGQQSTSTATTSNHGDEDRCTLSPAFCPPPVQDPFAHSFQSHLEDVSAEEQLSDQISLPLAKPLPQTPQEAGDADFRDSECDDNVLQAMQKHITDDSSPVHVPTSETPNDLPSQTNMIDNVLYEDATPPPVGFSSPIHNNLVRRMSDCSIETQIYNPVSATHDFDHESEFEFDDVKAMHLPLSPPYTPPYGPPQAPSPVHSVAQINMQITSAARNQPTAAVFPNNNRQLDFDAYARSRRIGIPSVTRISPAKTIVAEQHHDHPPRLPDFVRDPFLDSSGRSLFEEKEPGTVKSDDCAPERRGEFASDPRDPNSCKKYFHHGRPLSMEGAAIPPDIPTYKEVDIYDGRGSRSHPSPRHKSPSKEFDMLGILKSNTAIGVEMEKPSFFKKLTAKSLGRRR